MTPNAEPTHRATKMIFASDLGIAPGRWPLSIDVDGESYALLRTVQDRDGDTLYALYRSKAGTMLEVAND